MKPARPLTIPETARALGVSRQRVLQLIRAGLVHAEKIPASGSHGFMYLISPQEVRRRRRVIGKKKILTALNG